MKTNEILDVVIIGSGFAGLAAAIEAKLAGASVLILEKMKGPGGNSIISDGGIAAPSTKLQHGRGIFDSEEQMYEDIMRAGLYLNQPSLVRKLVTHANEAFEWSIDYLGVEYLDKVDIFGGHSVFRCYTAKNVTGATIIKRQLEKVESLGVEVRYQNCFKEFVVDDKGKITGIVARVGYDYKDEDAGYDIQIDVRKGVVLATGGFGSDIDFRAAQDPRLTEAIDTTNKPFATAEAMKQTFRIGALPVHLSHIQLGPWASPDERGYGVGPMFSEYVVFQYGMIVDPQTGRRFVNELADRKTVSDKMLTIGHPCIGLADSQAVEVSGWSIEKCLERKIVLKFETLVALADHYGINPKALEDSVKSFNLSVTKGVDQIFGKPILELASPISKPPFFAIRLWPKVHHTMGGVGINEDAEVVDLDGKVIEGLYAAGEVTGGVHGASRLGSCSITDCFVFGRIAGKNVANRKTRLFD